MPTSLMGLSPEEIRGVSAKRSQVASGQRQQLGMLIDLLGQKSKEEYYGAQTALTKAKTKEITEPKMTSIKINDIDYNIPEASLLEGLKTKTDIEDKLRKGEISEAEYNQKSKPVTIYMPGADGNMIPIKTTQGGLKAMADSIKSITETREKVLKEQRRTAGLEALGETTLQGIEDIPLKTLLTGAPEATSAVLSRKVEAETAKGMEPKERDKLLQQHEITSTNLKKVKNLTHTGIQAYNERSNLLKYPSMMYIKEGIISDEGIEVKLPVVNKTQMMPQDVIDDAKTLGISTDELLKKIHKKMEK